MAAFYDAYKGDVARVNVHGLNPGGSAAKSFGDAFASFGKSMQEAEARNSRMARYDADTKSLNDETAAKQQARGQAEIDDALVGAFGDYTTKDEFNKNVGGIELASPDVKQKMEQYYQGRFNDEAVKVSVTGGYDDFKGFKGANPDLVQNADGTTMAKIEQYFAGKDKRTATAKAAEKEAKYAKELLKMQAKVTKAAKGGKGGFEYTEQTDAKIAAQVKTAMGMDAPDFTFTDAKKKEYEDSVSGAAKISKKYNLEPSLAIHVYMNPDLYDFTADGKVVVKKMPAPVEDKTKESWKDYTPDGMKF